MEFLIASVTSFMTIPVAVVPGSYIDDIDRTNIYDDKYF